MGRHQTSRQRPQWPELTGEDELLLHHVDVPAGPPDGGAQHDLLGVVAAHAAGAVPAGGRSQVREELQFLALTQSGRRGRDFPTSRGESDCMWKSGKWVHAQNQTQNLAVFSGLQEVSTICAMSVWV